MAIEAGQVFSIAADNQPVPGGTISKALLEGADGAVIVFSMAAGTEISSENYQTKKLYWVLDGAMEVMIQGKTSRPLTKNEALWTPVNVPVGTSTSNGAVYLEIAPERIENMNELKAGEIFELASLVPYQEGAIINRDVLKTPGMKFAVMSFDDNTGLSEHAAPGNALVFALEGEATITYEGVPHVIHAGEQMLFAKNGRHAIQANGKFKMALLISLEQ